jgi:serine/threonine-protein kinase RsbW
MPTVEQHWRRDFPGNAAELRPLREWLAGLLPEAPARDDAIMVAVELATNAVKHTASGQDGFFAVEITWHAQPTTVRIAVADGGARAGPQESSGRGLLSEHGRGLQVVLGLASRVGACGDEGGRLIWADVPWTDQLACVDSAAGQARWSCPTVARGIAAGAEFRRSAQSF